MQWGLRKCLQAGRVGGGVHPDLGERKEETTGDLSSLNQLWWGNSVGLLMDNHRPQWAVPPPGTAPVGTQDPPHQARGGFQDSRPLQPVSLGFSLELFLDSELMAGHPAQVNRKRPSGLKLRPPPLLPVYQAGSAPHDPRCCGGSELREALKHAGPTSSPGTPGGSI